MWVPWHPTTTGQAGSIMESIDSVMTSLHDLFEGKWNLPRLLCVLSWTAGRVTRATCASGEMWTLHTRQCEEDLV